MLKKISALSLALLMGVTSALAQDAQTRSLTAGQKYKIKGVVVEKDDTSFIVRDAVGVNTRVAVAPNTSIKTKGGFFGGGDAVAANQIVRGLNLEVEGRGDNSGSLTADKVRFGKDDFRVAQSIDSRVTPAEERLDQAEQNAQRISGQIEELVAISNSARGGAKAAQDTADAAIAGVNATNQRLSAVDDYVVQSTQTVNFRVNSSVLSPEGKQNLDALAQNALTMKGYLIEVTGFASADGDAKKNKELSRRRAQAVLDYLIETHNIPLRRIGVSYGFGEAQAIADNSTPEGRAQNRRVEVKLTVSKGLNQNVEVRPATATDNGGDQ
ncbi:MAG: OmpA/MotB family outer membrane protein [Acidobacteria bacterium]|jgi:outer membrane protein OmpA-like peptidoglycan-associated protein|nr:OmpA/MotB family outer membrane protein [Acidobacteriota bacterium]